MPGDCPHTLRCPPAKPRQDAETIGTMTGTLCSDRNLVVRIIFLIALIVTRKPFSERATYRLRRDESIRDRERQRRLAISGRSRRRLDRQFPDQRSLGSHWLQRIPWSVVGWHRVVLSRSPDQARLQRAFGALGLSSSATVRRRRDELRASRWRPRLPTAHRLDQLKDKRRPEPCPCGLERKGRRGDARRRDRAASRG